MTKQCKSFQELSKRTSTNVMCTNGITSVAYHNTVVFHTDGQELTLDTGGFKTKTTKDRMNTALNLCSVTFPLHLSVIQRKNKWFVVDGDLNRVCAFDSDSITINLDAIREHKHVA